VGSYASSCSGAADANYTISYVNGSVTVNRATLTITASSQTSYYGTAPVAVTASYSGFVNGDTAPAVAPTCSTAVTKTTAVGHYPTVCNGASDPNYTISYVNGTDTVAPALLVISASSGTMVYGTNPPAVTAIFSGLVNGNTVAQALSKLPTCSTTATSTSNVGTYPATCQGAVSRGNYSLSYVSNVVTVTPAPITIAPKTISIVRSSWARKVTFSATVTNAASHKVAPGVTVVFSATSLTGYVFGCTAVTNASGVATCTNTNVLATALQIPPVFTVKGSGANYQPATATGRISLF
jgi:hypothetical protein